MRNFIRLFRNNSGLTLIEIMIAAGIMSAIAYGMVTFFQTQKNTQKNLELRSEALAAVSNMKLLLINSTACKHTFTGFNVSTCSNGTSKCSMNTTGIRDKNNTVQYRISPALNSSFANTSLVMISMDFTKYNPAVSNLAEIAITFNHYKGPQASGKLIGTSVQSFPISVRVVSNVIQSCYSDSDATVLEARKQVCTNELSGSWNDITLACTIVPAFPSGAIAIFTGGCPAGWTVAIPAGNFIRQVGGNSGIINTTQLENVGVHSHTVWAFDGYYEDVASAKSCCTEVVMHGGMGNRTTNTNPIGENRPVNTAVNFCRKP